MTSQRKANRFGTFLAVALALLCWDATSMRAQSPSATPKPFSSEVSPRRAPLADTYLENLVGDWTITRKIRGLTVTNSMRGEWVLQHQFVQLHMVDSLEPPAYEALVLVGYDAGAKKYVAHWCDNFGGQFSGVGYGRLQNNRVEFVFDYAEGPFHNTFSWDPLSKTWTFLMQSETADGTRQFFAEDTLRKK